MAQETAEKLEEAERAKEAAIQNTKKQMERNLKHLEVGKTLFIEHNHQSCIDSCEMNVYVTVGNLLDPWGVLRIFHRFYFAGIL